MALSKAAQKLLDYLGIYKISATEYSERISGVYPNDALYNVNWIVGKMDSEGKWGRVLAAPQKGTFKSALAELVQEENPTTTTTTTTLAPTTTTTSTTTTTTTTI